MIPSLKAKELLEKMNNGKISKALWDNCSEYARNDLKRKALIVVDEILNEYDNKILSGRPSHLEACRYFWESVKDEIQKL